MSGGGTCRPWERRASAPGQGDRPAGPSAAGVGAHSLHSAPRHAVASRKSSLKVGVDGWSAWTASDRTSAAFVVILVFWRIVSVAAVDGRRPTRDRGPREPPTVSRGHSCPRGVAWPHSSDEAQVTPVTCCRGTRHGRRRESAGNRGRFRRVGRSPTYRPPVRYPIVVAR